jgi:RND family efflux transporter MFP subunit
MDEQERPGQSNAPAVPGRAKKIVLFLLRYALGLLIVAVAVLYFIYLMENRPKAPRRPSDQQARLVEVQTVSRQSLPVLIQAMGTVTAAREVTVYPEVSGLIESIAPQVVPGAFVEPGQVLYEIDSRNYQTILAQRQSELQQARLNLKIEEGSQRVARREYQMLGDSAEEADEDLILRRPYLEAKTAAAAAAEAAVRQAQLDVQRCTIRAPFRAVIREKFAELGSRVSQTTPLVSLVGIDEFWVQLLVPVDQLGWIQFPQEGLEGAEVRINDSAWGRQVFRRGKVLRLLPHLEEQGRMARVLVSVPSPLESAPEQSLPPLLLGSYVRAEIIGRTVSDIFAVPREYIRNGNQVWVMDENNQLRIQTVQIVFRGPDTVYVSGGMEEGRPIVTTDLSAPVEGMLLRTAQQSPTESPSSGRAGENG